MNQTVNIHRVKSITLEPVEDGVTCKHRTIKIVGEDAYSDNVEITLFADTPEALEIKETDNGN